MLHKHNSPNGDAFVRIAHKIKEFVDTSHVTMARKGKLMPWSLYHLVFLAQETLRQVVQGIDRRAMDMDLLSFLGRHLFLLKHLEGLTVTVFGLMARTSRNFLTIPFAIFSIASFTGRALTTIFRDRFIPNG